MLRGLIAGIVGTAATAIFALLSPDFGDTQAKTLGTAATFSVASLNAMASASAWNARARIAYAPIVGVILAYLCGAFVILGIWVEPESESYWRWTFLLGAIAVVAAHASLVRRVPLAANAERIGLVAIGTGALVALILVRATWNDDPSDATLRFLGVATVVFAATTIAVPVVHFLSPRNGAEQTLPAAAEALRYCPACGALLDTRDAARGSCAACGARFVVRFERSGR
jgi:MFS family permease